MSLENNGFKATLVSNLKKVKLGVDLKLSFRGHQSVIEASSEMIYKLCSSMNYTIFTSIYCN